jgi:hypothetical protein
MENKDIHMKLKSFLNEHTKKNGIRDLDYSIYDGNEIDLEVDLITSAPIETINILMLQEQTEIDGIMLEKSKSIFTHLLKLQNSVSIKQNFFNEMEVVSVLKETNTFSESEINEKLKFINENTKDTKIKRMIKEQKLIGIYSKTNDYSEKIINLFTLEMIGELEDFLLYLEKKVIEIYYGLEKIFNLHIYENYIKI